MHLALDHGILTYVSVHSQYVVNVFVSVVHLIRSRKDAVWFKRGAFSDGEGINPKPV